MRILATPMYVFCNVFVYILCEQGRLSSLSWCTQSANNLLLPSLFLLPSPFRFSPTPLSFTPSLSLLFCFSLFSKCKPFCWKFSNLIRGWCEFLVGENLSPSTWVLPQRILIRSLPHHVCHRCPSPRILILLQIWVRNKMRPHTARACDRLMAEIMTSPTTKSSSLDRVDNWVSAR